VGSSNGSRLARALVSHPKLILADEPTGNLDTANGETVMDLLTGVSQSGTTVIMVTIRWSMPLAHSERVRLLDGHWSTRHCWRLRCFAISDGGAAQPRAQSTVRGHQHRWPRVGLAAAILIGLFVRDEFSYDSFIPGHQRVFRVATNRILPGRARCSFRSFRPTWPVDEADFPGVQSVARLASETVGLRHGNFEASETLPGRS